MCGIVVLSVLIDYKVRFIYSHVRIAVWLFPLRLTRPLSVTYDMYQHRIVYPVAAMYLFLLLYRNAWDTSTQLLKVATSSNACIYYVAIYGARAVQTSNHDAQPTTESDTHNQVYQAQESRLWRGFHPCSLRLSIILLNSLSAARCGVATDPFE